MPTSNLFFKSPSVGMETSDSEMKDMKVIKETVIYKNNEYDSVAIEKYLKAIYSNLDFCFHQQPEENKRKFEQRLKSELPKLDSEILTSTLFTGNNRMISDQLARCSQFSNFLRKCIKICDKDTTSDTNEKNIFEITQYSEIRENFDLTYKLAKFNISIAPLVSIYITHRELLENINLLTIILQSKYLFGLPEAFNLFNRLRILDKLTDAYINKGEEDDGHLIAVFSIIGMFNRSGLIDNSNQELLKNFLLSKIVDQPKKVPQSQGINNLVITRIGALFNLGKEKVDKLYKFICYCVSLHDETILNFDYDKQIPLIIRAVLKFVYEKNESNFLNDELNTLKESWLNNETYNRFSFAPKLRRI